MAYQLFQIIHLFSVITLAGVTFAALAAPRPEGRRFSLMCSGILALLAFVSGFGMAGLAHIGFPGWLIVKLACWLGLAAVTGLAYRRPGQVKSLTAITALAIFIAVGMVVLKPF